jgi:FKBP-type peptidyl-prolyl cis-trans isomerase FkpA
MIRKGWAALLLGVAVVALSCKGTQATPQAGASPQALTGDEKAVSALGSAIGQQAGQAVKALNLTPAEREVFQKALVAAVGGEKSGFTMEEYGPKLQTRAQAQAATVAAAEKQKSAAFREAAAAEPGAVKTASGLVFRSIKPGTGAVPKAADVVRVHYHGTLADGTVFDSSVQRGQPAEFPLNGVIPCWTEGVQRMKVGEKARLVCPSEIAYGDQGQAPVIPGGATLVFEVELLGIGGSKASAPQGR